MMITQKWTNYTHNKKKIWSIYATETHVKYGGYYISYRLNDIEHFYVNNEKYQDKWDDDPNDIKYKKNETEYKKIKINIQHDQKGQSFLKAKMGIWNIKVEKGFENSVFGGGRIHFQNTFFSTIQNIHSNISHNLQGIVGQTIHWIGKTNQEKKKYQENIQKNILRYRVDYPFNSNEYVTHRDDCKTNNQNLIYREHDSSMKKKYKAAMIGAM